MNEYDGSAVMKDKVLWFIVTLNNKLAPLKSLDESILAEVEKPHIVTEVEESEEFRTQSHVAKTNLTNRVFQLKVSTQNSGNCTSGSLLVIQKNGTPFGTHLVQPCTETNPSTILTNSTI